jgi:thiamine pyrophosphate-dependent acetolactate synthase large subunit-like protein
VLSDVGAHKLWLARMYSCYRPGTCIISNGFASIGIAVPGAVAAKLLYPERHVVAVSGAYSRFAGDRRRIHSWAIRCSECGYT